MELEVLCFIALGLGRILRFRGSKLNSRGRSWQGRGRCIYGFIPSNTIIITIETIPATKPRNHEKYAILVLILINAIFGV